MHRSGWGNRIIEGSLLGIATLCFVAALIVAARIHFLCAYEFPGFGDLVLLLALAVCFGVLGWLAILALRIRLTSPRSALRSGSDRSRRPLPRDSRC